MAYSNQNWFNTWPDGLIGLNKHQQIVEVSPVAQSILGYGTDELKGKHPHDAFCADNRDFSHDKLDCKLTDLEENNETASTLWRHKNGHFLSIDYRIMPVTYGDASRIISFVDNSTRSHNHAEMKKFSEYVERSPAPLAEFVMDGQLLFANNALQELLLEYGFDDKGAAVVIPKNVGAIGKALQESDKSYDITEIRMEDDRVFVWHFHLLENSGGEPTMVGYAFDITAQKEAEHIAEEQSSQARKEFYAKMVHELRSPLNAIVGFSDLLLLDLEGKLSEEDLKRLKMIKEAGEQLNEQVTATLDVAKIESGKMSLDISEFAIHDVCKEVYEQHKGLAEEKEIEFKFSSSTELRIFSDRTKVRQIVVNLVSNAIKYTKSGRIAMILVVKDDKQLGKCMSVAVLDTGIGIPDDQLPRLFKSFEQIGDSQASGVVGTGLGLALVYNLVTLLAGKINVKSTYGKGSCFEVLLPFMSDQ